MAVLYKYILKVQNFMIAFTSLQDKKYTSNAASTMKT